MVVVVVAHDPGEWFEETLNSLAAQTYTNLSVLVIDAASAEPLERRVAAILPGAHQRRLEHNPGFGPACNEVMAAVRGAAFYLLCHDDVALEPDAVRLMVEEAFRANAGIVGPKLVRWDQPEYLLSLGMGADRFGQPSPLVERGELDQSQHDSMREVFFVPGAATLIRADLYAALDGFDPLMDLHGEDLDICWRAHVAGARVVVAPGARVAHMEALGVRRPRDDRRRYQLRHRMRSVRKCTGRWRRWWVTVQTALLNLIEAVYALFTGRLGHLRDLVGSWWWNFRHGSDLRARRRELARMRSNSDADLRRMQVSGSARLRAFMRRKLAGGDEHLVRGGATGRVTERLRASTSRATIIVWALVAVVLALGSRGLATGELTAVGDFVAFPEGAGGIWDAWFSAERSVGLDQTGPAPPALGLFWLVSVLVGGATDLARTVLVLAALPLGVLGAWRLATPLRSRRARIVALLAFVANPLIYNAIAQGRWAGLVLCGLSPWILLHLAKASRIAPFDGAGGSAPRPAIHHIVAVGVLVAIGTLWVPATGLMVVAISLALVVGGLAAGVVAGAWRLLLTGLGGAVLGAVLCAPWTVSLITSQDSAALLGPALGGVPDISTGSLLRFETGPIGASPLSWALLAAGVLGLLIGRQWRLGWAARAWGVVLFSWGSVLALEVAHPQVIPAELLPTPEVLLAAGVAALAMTAAMSMASFEADLPGYRFGWRQMVSLLAAGGLLVALVPIAASAFGGRWELPEREFNEKLGFVVEERAETPFRVVWLGEADTLPLAGWKLDAPSLTGDAVTLMYASTDQALPGPEALWPGAESAATGELGEALAFAAEGGTSRLGEMLAPMGVRYLMVPERLAPDADGESPDTGESEDLELARRPVASAPDAVAPVVDSLQRQLDLSSIPVGGDLRVFENAAWESDRGVPGERESVETTDRAAALATPVMWLVAIGYLLRTRVSRDERIVLSERSE